jgi:Periplasmic copper-binding protein (NosD)
MNQALRAALTIGDGVQVNGNGFWLWGSTQEGTGVLFHGTKNSQVGWLHVTGFRYGVQMRAGASGNVFHSAWVWDHEHIGLWLQAGSGNWVWNVYSTLNNGPGISLQDTQGSVIGYSIAWSNHVSLEPIRANQNTIWVNGFYGDQGDALAMTDSHGNGFYWNHFVCHNEPIVLQNSADNHWHQNLVQCPIINNEVVASTD